MTLHSIANDKLKNADSAVLFGLSADCVVLRIVGFFCGYAENQNVEYQEQRDCRK